MSLKFKDPRLRAQPSSARVVGLISFVIYLRVVESTHESCGLESKMLLAQFWPWRRGVDLRGVGWSPELCNRVDFNEKNSRKYIHQDFLLNSLTKKNLSTSASKFPHFGLFSMSFFELM